jgi:hypothetical protein
MERLRKRDGAVVGLKGAVGRKQTKGAGVRLGKGASRSSRGCFGQVMFTGRA